MISTVKSISLMGIDGFVVDIEVDIEQGLPNFTMVGLAELVVKESKERVRAAIKNCGYLFPVDRIIINFAPADVKKEGTHLDLAVAIGILSSSFVIKNFSLDECAFIGELSLNGDVRPVRGILPMVLEARSKKFKKIFVPYENRNEVNFVEDILIYGVLKLNEIVDFLNDESPLEVIHYGEGGTSRQVTFEYDFSEVKGQKMAKRAVEIAASGNHNLLMIGSPGGGKTMLAQRIPTILPELTYESAIEVTKIYSIAGMLKDNCKMIFTPPYRNPHHTASGTSIIGGGSNPCPGEISLAHEGVLFLDEFPEFRRDTIEALRQPMEDGRVSISRVKGKFVYPSRFMLIGSMNPCPCGYFGYQLKECRCTPLQIKNYLNKISGPVLDRIDIHISVEPIKFGEINSTIVEETSREIKNRVERVRNIQLERFSGEGINCNAQMKPKHIKRYCKFNERSMSLLENAFKVMSLSTRAYNKILKITRTIADMCESKDIEENHVAEAIQYRLLDRKYWG
jgi:magnesium chelatase family protein